MYGGNYQNLLLPQFVEDCRSTHKSALLVDMFVLGSACDIQDDASFGIEEQWGRGTRREMTINTWRECRASVSKTIKCTMI